ncbi:hypothetical protein RRG08_044315, partial [Elysia crispata]
FPVNRLSTTIPFSTYVVKSPSLVRAGQLGYHNELFRYLCGFKYSYKCSSRFAQTRKVSGQAIADHYNTFLNFRKSIHRQNVYKLELPDLTA